MSDRFREWKYPEINEGELTKYNWLVQHKDKLQLGYKTDIGVFTYINAKNGVVIEDFVQIGSHCSIYSISTIDGKEGKVVMKKNCKIGSHSVIMPGVTIGENSVVGAGAVVTADRWLQRAGFVADVPLWELIGALVLAQVSSSIATTLIMPGSSGWRLWLRVGVMCVAIGLVCYLTGWGATLAVGFVFGAAECIRVEGSHAARPAIVWMYSYVVPRPTA